MSCDVVPWCASDHGGLVADWEAGAGGVLSRVHEDAGSWAYVFAEERFGERGVDLGIPMVRVDLDAALTPSQAREVAADLLRSAEVAEGRTPVLPTSPGCSDEALMAMLALDMRARACRPRSIKEMQITLRAFARHMGKPLVEATRNDVIAYLTRPGLAPVSIRTYRTALSTFYRFLVDEGILTVSPTARLPRVRMPHTEPDPVSTEEIQRLLSSGIRRRTRMMVLLAAYQGLRAVEISQVRGDAIDWDGMQITVRGGKGGTELVRPLHTRVAEYAREAGFPDWDWWFPGMPGREHVTAQQVSTTLARAFERAGIVGHRPHQIRAWHATELIESGVDAVTVQYSMRHANLASLHKYARPSNDRIRDAIEGLPELRI